MTYLPHSLGAIAYFAMSFVDALLHGAPNLLLHFRARSYMVMGLSTQANGRTTFCKGKARWVVAGAIDCPMKLKRLVHTLPRTWVLQR